MWILFTYLVFLCILPICYFMMRNNTKSKKNIVLGVTLPYAARQDPDVLALCRRFRLWLGVGSLILAAASLPILLFDRLSILLCLLLVWTEVVMIFYFILFSLFNSRLAAMKRERGWKMEGKSSLVIDTSTVDLPYGRIHWVLFLLPLLISCIPLIPALRTEDWAGGLLVAGCGVGMCALFWILHSAIFRQRAEMVDDNSALTATLTRVRRRRWGVMCVISSWATACFFGLLWFCMHSVLWGMILTVAYTTLLILLALWADLGLRRIQQKLTVAAGRDAYVDEDSQWILGSIYYNPNDRHLMKNDRVGMNMTVNIAHPAGKVLGIACALLILTLPLWGVWLIAEDNTPPALTITETSLTASHLATRYEIPLSEVVDIALLETLPPLSRIAGTGMDTVLKGRFRDGDGMSCQVCLDPTVSPYLRIETEHKLYYLADRNPEVTRQVFAVLQAEIS